MDHQKKKKKNKKMKHQSQTEDTMSLRYIGKSLKQRVKMCNGPFRSMLHLYNNNYHNPPPPPDSGTCGSMERRFFVMQRNGGLFIFTYDDSDEFRPTFKHHFDLTHTNFLAISDSASSFLCVRDKAITVILTEPSFKEVTLNPLVDQKVTAGVFSPQENFIYVLFSLPHKAHNRYKLEFREAGSGKIRKTLKLTINWGMGDVYTTDFLKWGFDDSYVALLATGVVDVFETKTFSRFKRFENMQNFGWLPSALTLLLFDDYGNAKIAEISNGGELDISGLEGANQHKPLWHSTGHYLACICIGTDFNKILLVSLKSGMSEFINPPHGDYIDLAWNKNGNEFAISFGTNDGQHCKVRFYTIQENGESLSHKIKTLQGIKANRLCWSPNGSYMVFKGKEKLCFYDVENHQQLASVDFIAEFIDWDPSSRFFVAQSSSRHLCERVWRIWSSCGEKLIDVGPPYLIMRWIHKQSFASGSSMLIDDDDDFGKDSSGNRDDELATEKRPGDSIVESSSKMPRLV